MASGRDIDTRWFRARASFSGRTHYLVADGIGQPRSDILSSFFFGSNSATITAAAGSFVLTGTAATLKFSRVMSAGSSTFTLTGSSANLRRGYALTATSGAYTLSGTAAALRSGRKVVAASTSLTLSATTAALKRGLRLTAAASSFGLIGTAATLTKEGGVNSYTLTALSGSFTLTGKSAGIYRGFSLGANPASFSAPASGVTFRRTSRLEAGGATFELLGSDIRGPSRKTAKHSSTATLLRTAALISTLRPASSSPARLSNRSGSRPANVSRGTR